LAARTAARIAARISPRENFFFAARAAALQRT
jgi:hypothetical protein